MQGAYLAAILLPGLLLGAGSLFFKDLTEGLGCVLGGFCISMWLLVLRPGGLIASTAAKSIFIGAFCLAALAVYISRHTRFYGMICSTSFSGATVIILGLDCFSRAGLKEFWIYIWGKSSSETEKICLLTRYSIALNGNIFPLLTITYPITRGMRVEIACVILISVFGIMSQLRIWKIVQARRQGKTAEMAEAKQRQDQLEEDIGRRLEEGNDQDRAEWEHLYNNRPFMFPHFNSRVGSEESASTWRPSSSFTDSNHLRTIRDQIEMNDFHRAEGIGPDDDTIPDTLKTSSKINVQALQDMGTPEAIRRPHVQSEQKPHNSSRMNTPRNSSCEQSEELVGLRDPDRVITTEDDSLAEPSGYATEAISTGIQEVIRDNKTMDKQSSMATFATSDYRQDYLAKRTSLTTVTFLSRPISKCSDQADLPAFKPQTELVDIDNESEGGTPTVAADDANHRVKRLRMSTTDYGRNNTDASYQRILARALNQPSHHEHPSNGQAEEGFAHTEDSLLISSLHKNSAVPASLDLAIVDRIELTNSNLADQLSGEASKEVLADRLNEWAKQLDTAEVPISDELSVSATTITCDHGQSDENATPVHPLFSKKTPLNARPEHEFPERSQVIIPPQPQSSSSIPTHFLVEDLDSRRQHEIRDLPFSQGPAKVEPLHIQKKKPYAARRTPTIVSSKLVPQQASTIKTREPRSSSSPMGESPIEEGVESSFSPCYSRSPFSATTLIAKRDSILRNKYSFRPVFSKSSIVDSSTPLTPDDSVSVAKDRSKSLDDDDISLSERRSLLRQQRRPINTKIPPRSFTDPSVRRESMLAAWRASFKHDYAVSQIPSHEMEARRTEMLRQKYRESLIQQEVNIAASVKNQALDQALRRGDMQDAHREVMRKMQADANRRLSEDSHG